MMNWASLITQIVFYVFAIGVILSALMVVTSRNPVSGVLFLVLSFIAMAGIWILLHAEFLALILVVVYVGAVMTLFLFVVMMLNVDLTVLKKSWVRYVPVGLLIVFFILALVWLVVGSKNFGLANYPAPAALPDNYSNVQELGLTLFTHFIYPFEIAGVILLVAMIAAITLAFRGPRNRRIEIVRKQLRTDPKTRVKLVSGEENV